MSRRLALLALVAAPVVPWSQRQIDARTGGYRATEEVLYLWSGEQVKRAFPGFESLAADVYWLRTVQYFGGERLFSRERRFELLDPLVEITTTLDPRLEIAYIYGAVFLSEPPPSGAGRPREGVALLEKGCRNLPLDWRLRQNLAFYLHLYLHDSHGAARVLLEAAKLPGAAYWLRTLAADLLAKGGDRASARRMWQQMFEQGEAGVIKENARVHLQILDSLDLADRLTSAVAVLTRRSGRRPPSLDALRGSGLWRGRLTDAAGVPFRYDESSGKVSISPESPMWRPE